MPLRGGQGWSRTSGLFRIREALFLLSYPPVSCLAMVPGQGLEPRPPRSERDVLPLDDPGPMCDFDDTFGASAKRCFPSHSPTLRPWIAGRRLRYGLKTSYV